MTDGSVSPKPRSAFCNARRRARSSGLAVRKILRSAWGKDDRSDIAALHHDVIMRGDTTLLLHEGRAHLGDGRHRADGLVDLWRANRSRYVDAIEGDGAGNGIAGSCEKTMGTSRAMGSSAAASSKPMPCSMA